MFVFRLLYVLLLHFIESAEGLPFDPSPRNTVNVDLEKCLSDLNVPAFYSGPEYLNSIDTYNTRVPVNPMVVVIATNGAHIEDGVYCAAISGVSVSSRGGGHSYANMGAGGKDGGMMIDMRAFNSVLLDENTWIVSVGGGTPLKKLGTTLAKHQRGVTHGNVATVGVTGQAVHGGFGRMHRVWGLTIDQIYALDVVLADGRLRTLRRGDAEFADLFYAFRGAAESFGVVVFLYLQTYPTPVPMMNEWSTSLTQIYRDENTFVAVFEALQTFLQDDRYIDPLVSSGINFSPQGVTFSINWVGDTQVFEQNILSPLRNILSQALTSSEADPTQLTSTTEVRVATYYTFCETYFMNIDHASMYAKSLAIGDNDPPNQDAIRSHARFIISKALGFTSPWRCHWILMGGPGSAVNGHDVTRSSYGGYNSLWYVEFSVKTDENAQSGIQFIVDLQASLTTLQPSLGTRGYHNWIDSELTPEEAWKLYYAKEAFEELVQTKAKWDPKNVFSNPQSIPLKLPPPSKSQTWKRVPFIT